MIAELFVKPRSREVSMARLGTDRHEVAYRRVRRLTLRRLRSRPAEFLFLRAQANVLIGVRLRNGRRVVIKVMARDRRPTRAQRRVQRAAADAGVPCPRPIVDRARIWRSAALIDEYLPSASVPGTGDGARAESAALLEDLSRRLGAAAGPLGARLPPHRRPPTDGVLWPPPHDHGADFAATAPGAEWIDEHARRALAIGPRSAGAVIVGHGDWTAHNLGYDAGGRIVAVYDFDDLARDHEPLFVGFAAITYLSSGLSEAPPGASPQEASAFVDAYELARGHPFSEPERRALGAAALYLVAYLARSEHALDPGSRFPDLSFRRLLARHGAAYLEV